MPLVTGIYVMSNIAYFSVLSPAAVLNSDAVAVVSTFLCRIEIIRIVVVIVVSE